MSLWSRFVLLFALLTAPAAAQTIPSGSWGSINYWGVGGLSQVLAPGSAGQCLTTQGVGSAPAWVNCQVSSLSLLPPINTNQFYGNVSGNFQNPIGVDVNTILNTVGYDIVRPPTPNSLLYKSNVGPTFNWQTLAPGAAGSLLTSGGATNPPFWSANQTQAGLNAICQTVGAILYYDTPSASWHCLNPGTSGQVLQTGGAGGNPSWLTVSANAPVTYSNGTIGITGTALTASSDTNVTATLGGSPSGALLAPASITMGWAGTLAVGRGGTGGSVASGTLLDNITGFSSTGFMTRQGAGSYSFQSLTNGITNGNLAQMPATTIKCNSTGSTANAADCASTSIPGTYTSTAIAGGNLSGFVAKSTGASYGWQDTAATTDKGVWDAIATGGSLFFRAVNDANNVANGWMTVARGAGASVATVAINTSFNQNGGIAYLGQVNLAGTFPATTSGGQTGALALGWNFTTGQRDVDFFNIDTTPPGTAFNFYQMTGASAATKLLSVLGNGYNIPTVLQGYADLRQFNSLPCNQGAPISTGVAQAAVNAYNAGWRRFFIPAGCFIYTGDAPWTAAFGTNSIPAATYWRGEDWNTSGFSVCSTYTGCTPGGGTTIIGSGAFQFETLFVMDGGCYNVDGAAFGRPAYCPVWNLMTNAASFSASTTYPGVGLILNIGAFPTGTWNGTDQPAIAINQETQGDDIFVNDVSTNTSSHILNFFNSHGTVGTWNVDGKALFGNTFSSHSTGMIQITDSFGSCQMFTNSSGSPGFSCSSDRRLKDDIRDAPDHLAWLSSFHVRDFTMKSDGSKNNTGVIAQELAVNHPEMVKEGTDGYLQAMGPEPWKMIKVMQQMQAEITELKRTLHAANLAPSLPVGARQRGRERR